MMKFLEQILKTKSYANFKTICDNGKLSHAYLVIGESNQINYEFCIAMALKLVCYNHKGCLSCNGCKKLLNGFHPDVFVYPQGKNIVVADSENIIENIAVKPLESEYKIFILNNIDLATVQAQNKLLKTVEEAPKNVVFIFNATNKNNVLNTIKSRTQEIEVENFSKQVLNEKENYSFVLEMLTNMKSSKQILDYVNKFAEKSCFMDNITTLYDICGELLEGKVSGNSKYESLANEFEINALVEIIGYITLAKKQFDANVSTNIIADNLLIKLLEVKHKWKTKY